MDAGSHEITFRLRLFVIYDLLALRTSRAATYCCQTDRLPQSTRLLVRARNGNVSLFCPALNSLKHFHKSSDQTANHTTLCLSLPRKLTVNVIQLQTEFHTVDDFGIVGSIIRARRGAYTAVLRVKAAHV